MREMSVISKSDKNEYTGNLSIDGNSRDNLACSAARIFQHPRATIKRLAMNAKRIEGAEKPRSLSEKYH